jgi:hypothetical protein
MEKDKQYKVGDYELPTYKQIMYHWPIKPVARNIALVLRDFAEEQMEMNENASKVTIAVGKLAKIVRATEQAVNSGLDELQSKGYVDSDRPQKEDKIVEGKIIPGRGKTPQAKTRTPYYFRLHIVKPQKKPKNDKKASQ